jgi:hypothetical protein
MDNSVPTFDLSGVDERTASEGASPHTLIPFAVVECLSIGEAAAIAGKSERTLRNWCVEHGIGRSVAGGAWAVSRVALQMVLEGDLDGLSAYHDGARAQYEPVARYYRRLGLGDLSEAPRVWRRPGRAPATSAKSAEGAALRARRGPPSRLRPPMMIVRPTIDRRTRRAQGSSIRI